MSKKLITRVFTFVAIIVSTYALVWYFVGKKASSYIAVFLNDSNFMGYKISYDKLTIRGFPSSFCYILKSSVLKSNVTYFSKDQASINLDEISLCADIFGNYINIKIPSVFEKYQDNSNEKTILSFNGHPNIVIKTAVNLALKAFVSRDLVFKKENIEEFKYHDNGFNVSDVNHNIIYSSKGGEFKILNTKIDNKNKSSITLDISHLGFKSLDVFDLNAKFDVFSGKNDAVFDLLDLSIQSDIVAVKASGKITKAHNHASYYIDTKIKNIESFSKFVHSQNSIIKEDFIHKMLLKISDNENNKEIEDIEFVIKKDPIGDIMYGKISALSLIQEFYKDKFHQPQK